MSSKNFLLFDNQFKNFSIENKNVKKNTDSLNTNYRTNAFTSDEKKQMRDQLYKAQKDINKTSDLNKYQSIKDNITILKRKLNYSN